MADSLSQSFTSASAAKPSNLLNVPKGDNVDYSVSGTFTGTVVLVRTTNGGQTLTPLVTLTGTGSGTVYNDGNSDAQYTFICTARASGTINTSLALRYMPRDAFTGPTSDGAAFITNPGVPTDGTTGAKLTGKGSLCFDTTNGEVYINTGTLASPAWKKITHA